MAIDAGTLLEVTLNQTTFNQQVLNVFQYRVNTMPGTVTPVQLAEAWWGHTKGAWRAIVSTGYGAVFKTVRLRELNNPAGFYAEYDVPSGEQAGLRTPPTQGEVMPPFCSVGVRLVVGTRLTRPGQKRISYLCEGDQVSGALQTAMNVLVQSLFNIIANPMTLPAPALTGSIIPIVTRKDSTGTVTANQDVTGYLVNANVTTQNTRKLGRGA